MHPGNCRDPGTMDQPQSFWKHKSKTRIWRLDSSSSSTSPCLYGPLNLVLVLPLQGHMAEGFSF